MKRVVPSARNWEFGIEHLSDLGVELLARRATEGNLFYGGGGEVPSNMQKRRLKVETKETSLKSRGSALTAAASYLKRLSLSRCRCLAISIPYDPSREIHDFEINIIRLDRISGSYASLSTRSYPTDQTPCGAFFETVGC
jgi:hypothetical protein